MIFLPESLRKSGPLRTKKWSVKEAPKSSKFSAGKHHLLSGNSCSAMICRDSIFIQKLVGGLEHLIIFDYFILFFHSVGNFIIPTDEVHHFSEG
jgi:hypothetical protein